MAQMTAQECAKYRELVAYAAAFGEVNETDVARIAAQYPVLPRFIRSDIAVIIKGRNARPANLITAIRTGRA